MNSGTWLALAALVVPAGHAVAQCTTGQVTNSGVTETAVVDFNGLNNGASVTVGGLTLSCTSNTNGPTVASYFANLANGASPTAPSSCAKFGELSGWTSGAVSSGQNVTFTSVTPAANVVDLAVSGTFGSVNRTQGVASLSTLFTGSLVCGRPVAPGYTGALTDRWQEQHRSGGLLWDFKRGVGHAIDPEKQVGTYGFTGTGASSALTHTYGSTTYSWRVFLHAAPNTYSFCNASNIEVVRAFVIANAGVSGSGCGSLPTPFPSVP